MNTYLVTGSWFVKANSQEDAENAIEIAVAMIIDEAELIDCDAELEE